MKKIIVNVRNWSVEQTYRYFLGISFMTLINFILLAITASESVKGLLPFEVNLSVIVLFLVPSSLFGVWFFGLILEKYIKYPQRQEQEIIKRSPNWEEVHSKLNRIEEKLNEVMK